MDKNKRTRILMIAGVAAVAGIFILLIVRTVMSMKGGGKEAEVKVTSQQFPELPDARVDNLYSKDAGYRAKFSDEEVSVEDFWGSLASEDIASANRKTEGGADLALVNGILGDEAETVVEERKEPEREVVPVESPKPKASVSSGGSSSRTASSSSGRRSSASSGKSSSSSSNPAQKKTAPEAAPVTVPEPEPEVIPEVPADLQGSMGATRPAAPVYPAGGVISSLDSYPVETVPEDWETGEARLIKCCFAKGMKVKSGQRITIRLLEPVYVDGTVIPENTRITATCSLSSRLMISVNGFEFNGKMYSARFSAFDINDGQEGIYCTSDKSSSRKTVESRGVSVLGDLVGSAVGSAAGSTLGSILNSAVSTGTSIASSEMSSLKEVDVVSGYQFYIKEIKR